MSPLDAGVDSALLCEFIDESLDNLTHVAELFVTLEAEPDNIEIVQAIFRPVHSIKGSTAYFGLTMTKSLSHEIETVLDMVRTSRLVPSTTIIDVLLRGIDELQAMLTRAREIGEEVEDNDAFDDLVNEVKGLAGVQKADEEGLWKELLGVLKSDSENGHYDLAKQLALKSQVGRKAVGGGEDKKEISPDEMSEPVRRLYDIFSDGETVPDAEEVESLFKKCQASPVEEIKELSTEGISDIKIFKNSVGMGDSVSRMSFLKLVRMIAALEPEKEETDSSGKETVTKEETKQSTSSTGSSKSTKTMRIPEESIDVFLAYVGDLVTIREMYGHLYGNLQDGMTSKNAAVELRRVNDSFNQLSFSLQTSIMDIRKVAVKVLLQRAPRMVRDIATKSKKQIEITLQGEDVKIDKSLIDTLDAPLSHMVRNAADHGIEKPMDREAAGKDPQGKIDVAVIEDGDIIQLVIKDDGKGLDRDALTKKAVEMGLIGSVATLTDEAILSLLFKSGVSTATEVSDISGRGVGMDVVKRSIESMGGYITVESEKGKGSEFKVCLPKSVSTQILQGFIVVVDNNKYVFPLESIVRCFRPQNGEVLTVKSRGECVKDGENLLSVCRLSDFFSGMFGGESIGSFEGGTMVVIEYKKQSVAIYVDGIEGVQQVVLKDINGLESQSELFLGGALMGDGSVAMIIDVEKVVPVGVGV